MPLISRILLSEIINMEPKLEVNIVTLVSRLNYMSNWWLIAKFPVQEGPESQNKNSLIHMFRKIGIKQTLITGKACYRKHHDFNTPFNNLRLKM